MTLVEQAIERLRALPPTDQESVAEDVLAMLERYDADYSLTPGQIEEVKRTLDGVRDGSVRLLTAEETEGMWRRLGA